MTRARDLFSLILINLLLMWRLLLSLPQWLVVGGENLLHLQFEIDKISRKLNEIPTKRLNSLICLNGNLLLFMNSPKKINYFSFSRFPPRFFFNFVYCNYRDWNIHFIPILMYREFHSFELLPRARIHALRSLWPLPDAGALTFIVQRKRDHRGHKSIGNWTNIVISYFNIALECEW